MGSDSRRAITEVESNITDTDIPFLTNQIKKSYCHDHLPRQILQNNPLVQLQLPECCALTPTSTATTSTTTPTTTPTSTTTIIVTKFTLCLSVRPTRLRRQEPTLYLAAKVYSALEWIASYHPGQYPINMSI